MSLLVTASIWALFVAATLWFPLRRGAGGFLVYLVTMTLNEVPLIPLLIFAASVAALIGDIPAEERALVAIGAVVSCGVVWGLVWVQVRARATAPVLRAALVAGLGTHHRDSSCVAGVRARWWRGIVLPLQRRSAAVERIRDVPYAGGSRAHRLDVYRPRAKPQGTARRRPVLIHLHAGGFVQGGKSREGVVILNHLAGHGWICLSANYRLGRDGAFPASLIDAKRAIGWAREHADELGADPGQVFVMGGSAGGHLAISAALTEGDARYQPGFEDADTRVAGAVVLYGYLGRRTPDPASSPAELVRSGAPAVMIVHGSTDTAVPPATARALAIDLRAVSASPVVYAELPGAQHGFDSFASVRARATAEAVACFLESVRARSDGS